MKILQVGAYPPPFGGVTVHLMRLHEQLCRRGKDSTIIDLTRVAKDVPGVVQLRWPEANSYLEELPRSVVHFHNFAPGHAGAYKRLAGRHITVLSLHNERFEDELSALGPVRRRVALSRLKQLHCIVVDSEKCREMAVSLFKDQSKIRTIPEFIPPTEVPRLDHPEILALRGRCRHLLASNASRMPFHKGHDLYGFDLMVEMLRRLVLERGFDVGVVFLISNADDEAYFDQIQERIRAAGLCDRWLFVTEPLEESSSLWRISDIVVRATNTDGNSLSVLEALSLGVPVVASDCVERPAGTTLFRTRVVDDLTQRVAAILADLPACRARLNEMPEMENVSSFIAMYDDLERKWVNHDA